MFPETAGRLKITLKSLFLVLALDIWGHVRAAEMARCVETCQSSYLRNYCSKEMCDWKQQMMLFIIS